MRKLSVIIPVYNEAPNLPKLMHRLTDIADTIPNVAVEYLFVDDHSHDDSFRILQELAAHDSRVRVMRLDRNCGSHTAIFAGLVHSSGEIVCTLPADMQTPPEILPDMLAKFDEGYRTVWAYRRTRNGSNGSLFFSQLYNRLMERLILPDRWNKGADVFLLDRRVIQEIKQNWQTDGNLFVLLAWLDIKPVTIGYNQAARHAGKSKWSAGAKIKLLLDTVFSFSLLPFRLLLLLGILLTLGGFGYLAAALGLDSSLSHLPAAIVLLVCGIQLLALSVVVEYLWRIARRRRGSLSYHVETKIGFPEK